MAAAPSNRKLEHAPADRNDSPCLLANGERAPVEPSVSVVIPAHNASRDLPSLLAALLPQLYSGDECLVVDDTSSDGTGNVASRFDLRVLRTTEQSGPAAARNLGARNAKGQILIFLDADVVPHSDVVDRFRSHFEQDSGLAAVLGSYDDTPAAPGIVSRYRNLLHCYTHLNGSREASTFWAGCGAIRRNYFELCGGFNEQRYPLPSIEDIELGVRLRRAGGRILLDPEIRVTHRKQWTLTSMLRTDIMARAVPWWELILGSGNVPNDLNLKISQRLSAALVLLATAVIPALLWSPARATVTIIVLLAIVIAMNAGFYRFLLRHAGTPVALLGVPLHFLYFACAGIGLAIAVTRNLVRPSEHPVRTGGHPEPGSSL